MPKPSRKERFLSDNPICCFCGGGTPAVETDHLPSRACFDKRMWPEGFEFPTCRQCNGSTDTDEQVVALYSRMLSNPDVTALSDEIGKYMSGVSNNNDEVFAEMADGAQRLSKDGGVFEVGDATHNAFMRVLPRWAKAFHYKETGLIVPATARIYVQWFSNANIGNIPRGAVEGRDHVLKRNGKNIGDQFAYITKNDLDHPDLGYYTAAFRRSFLSVMLVDFHGKVIKHSSP